MTAVRRTGCSGTPSGKWCAGVSSAAAASCPSSSSTTAPFRRSRSAWSAPPSRRSRRERCAGRRPRPRSARARANTRARSSTALRVPAQMTIGVRRRAHPAGPAEVFGERLAQFGPAARITDAQCVSGGGGSARPAAGQPRAAGEGRHVRGAGHQVVRRRGRDYRGARREPDAHAGVDHPGAGALPRRQPALGDQVGVCLGDRVARQAEVGGKAARRRQHRSRRAAGRTVPRRAARDSSSRAPRAAGPDDLAQVQVQIAAARIGPRIHAELNHGDGSYRH